jgi:hypothetical protein
MTLGVISGVISELIEVEPLPPGSRNLFRALESIRREAVGERPRPIEPPEPLEPAPYGPPGRPRPIEPPEPAPERPRPIDPPESAPYGRSAVCSGAEALLNEQAAIVMSESWTT